MSPGARIEYQVLRAVNPQAKGWCGALDMVGNVSEWVAGRYHKPYYLGSPSENPGTPQSQETRVVRGGSWSVRLDTARVGYRLYSEPDARHDRSGLRRAKTPWGGLGGCVFPSPVAWSAQLR